MSISFPSVYNIVQEIVGNKLKDDVFPAIGISISLGNKLESVVLGYSSIGNRIKADEESKFHIASLSKQFTAYLIADLLSREKISLDDLVSQYLVWLPSCFSRVKIKHLLFHTSGVKDQWCLGYFSGIRSGDTILTDDVKRWMQSQDSLNFNPGNEFMYSNSGYTLLSMVVEIVEGLSYEELLKKKIFDPLGMRNSVVISRLDIEVIDNVSGYLPSGTNFIRSDVPYAVLGSTCIRMSLSDIAKWASQDIESNFFSRVKKVGYFERGALDDGSAIDYGFGQMHASINGREVLMHNGFDFGFNASIVRLKDGSASGVVLASGWGEAVEGVLPKILCDLNTTIAEEVNFDGSPRDAEKSIVGVYSSEDFRDVRRVVMLDSGCLYLDWMQGFTMSPVANGAYTIAGGRFNCRFIGDELNTKCEISGGGKNILLSKQSEMSLDWGCIKGRYFSSELSSVINIFVVDGDPYIKVGRNAESKIIFSNHSVLVWNGYWAVMDWREGLVTKISCSHPRCLNVVFSRM